MKNLEAKIIAKEGEGVVLEIEKQKISLNADYLPEAAVGAKIKLFFLNPEDAVTSDKKIAKIILEEILNGK